MILQARRELPRHVWKPASRSRRAVRRSFGVRRVSEHGGSYPGDPEKERRAQQPLQGTRTGSDARTLGPRACVRPKICAASPCSATAPRASAPLRPAPGASEDGAAPNYLSTCLRPARAPLSPRALTLRRSCARTPKSDQLVPALRPTDGSECARALRRWCGGEGADAARRAAHPAPNVVPRPAV